MIVSDNKQAASNIDPGHRMQMLDAKKQMLSQKNDEYKQLGEKRAEAKRDYDIEYARQLLQLKADGTPITICKDLCKGNRAVAELSFAYDVAAVIEKACLESLKDIREAIGADRSILTWLREEKGQN